MRKTCLVSKLLRAKFSGLTLEPYCPAHRALVREDQTTAGKATPALDSLDVKAEELEDPVLAFKVCSIWGV